jgi:hypothetical protein
MGRITVGKFILEYKLHKRVPRDPMLDSQINIVKERYFRIIELSTSIQLSISTSDSGLINALM